MKRKDDRIKRREFLRKSAACSALAGFTIVPRHVLGAGQTPPSEKVNVAAIGMGTRGPQVIREMENHNIVALCDVDLKFLSRAAMRYDNAKTYIDYRSMLEREHKTIDAVVVATPDHHHATATMAALKAGKHVYCDLLRKTNGTQCLRVSPADRSW